MYQVDDPTRPPVDGATEHSMTAASPKIDVQKIAGQGHVLLRFDGAIDEDFATDELARGLSADTLVIDLSGIKRVTSFGIREWIGFIDRAGKQCKRIYLVDCSPRIVVQLNMVVRFSGNAAVLSILAPYACDSCGTEHDRRLSLIEHEAEIRAQQLADQTCDSCGGESVFDDDPERYLSFAVSQPRPTVPPDTSAFLARHLDYKAGPGGAKMRATKLIEGDHTIIRLVGELSNTLPVNELEEGLERHVAIDVMGVSRATPSGAHLWGAFVGRLLAESVSTAKVFGINTELLGSIRDLLTNDPNLQVHSVALPYRCERCTLSSIREISVARFGSGFGLGNAPKLDCPDCKGSLECTADDQTLLRYGELTAPDKSDDVEKLVEAARKAEQQQEHAGFDQPEQPTTKRGLGWPWIVAGSVSVGAIVAIGILLFFPDAPEETQRRARYYEASHLSAPSWKGKSFFVENDNMYAIGESTISPDKATAFAEANYAGMELLLHQLLERIREPWWKSLIGGQINAERTRVLSALEATHKYDRQKLEQLRHRLRKRRQLIAQSWAETSRRLVPPDTDANYWESYREDSGDLSYRVWARTRLSQKDFNRALKYYTAKHAALGASVVAYFPLLSWTVSVDRGAVVSDVTPGGKLAKAGVQVGDVVLHVNDQTVSDGVSCKNLLEQAYAHLQTTGGKLKIDLLRRGQGRKILELPVAKSRFGGRRGGPGAPKMPPANIWHDDPSQ